MKTTVLGRKVKVEFEVIEAKNGEPSIKKSFLDLNEEVVVKELENELEICSSEKIYLTKDIFITVKDVRKTFDEVFVITDYTEQVVDSDEEEFANKLLTKKKDKFASNLLFQYPNISNMLDLMGIDKTNSDSVIKAVKSFNGIQNDFFNK